MITRKKRKQLPPGTGPDCSQGSGSGTGTDTTGGTVTG